MWGCVCGGGGGVNGSHQIHAVCVAERCWVGVCERERERQRERERERERESSTHQTHAVCVAGRCWF